MIGINSKVFCFPDQSLSVESEGNEGDDELEEFVAEHGFVSTNMTIEQDWEENLVFVFVCKRKAFGILR